MPTTTTTTKTRNSIACFFPRKFQYAGSYFEDATRLLANSEFKFTMMKKAEGGGGCVVKCSPELGTAMILNVFLAQRCFCTLLLRRLKYR